jgi:VWFA-related protein
MMIRTGLLFLTASSLLFSQDSSVIRIDVNLVQVDAAVTDSKNNHVANLKAGDFEVLQDGKPQTITNFSYISGTPNSPKDTEPSSRTSPLPPAFARQLNPGQVRRTIAFVVDDLGLAFDSVARVRDGLGKFIDSDMQPEDMVTIVRTGAGSGVLQQFTTDWQLLHAAVASSKFNVSRVDVTSFAPAVAPGPMVDPAIRQRLEKAIAKSDEQRNGMLLGGTITALRYVIAGLAQMPGRKSIVLISENLALDPEGLRDLVDTANRASVVVNSIDPRGLETYLDPGDTDLHKDVTAARNNETFESQDGLAALVSDTGGLFMQNRNSIDGAVHEIAADSEGYYLIGYHPDSATFEGAKSGATYHKVEVRLKVSGLHVRSRHGFLGQPDATRKPMLAGNASLDLALLSPFSAADVHVHLTTVFTQTPDRQSRLTAMLYIDTHDLSFSPQPDGTQRASFEIAAMTLGDTEPKYESRRSFSLDVQPDQYQALLSRGLFFAMNQQVRRPGWYQVRVALHDQNSGRLGSATELVEVPDLAKGRLALSSILLRGDAQGTLADVDRAEGQVADSDPASAAALRVFKPGDSLYYQYLLFNARANRDIQPNLKVQTRLFRDGKQIYAGQPMIPKLAGEASSGRLTAGGHMTLAPRIAPGQYVLQVLVVGEAVKQKDQIASQSIDFEIRP